MARGVAANEAGDGAALRIQTLLPVARRGYGTVWIDCGELWALPRVPQPPKARGGAAIAWHAHLDLRETRNLDLRINCWANPDRGKSRFCRNAFERRDPADVHDDAARARGLAVAEAWRSDLAIAEAER